MFLASPLRARPIVAGALLALGVILGAPAAAAAQVAVDQVELYLAPGVANRQSAVMNVSNVGDKAIQATLYLNDWDRDSVGDTRFFPVGQLRESCRDRIQVFPATLRLEPRSQQAVRVTYSGPDSLKQACWTVVFVEMADLQPARGRMVQYVLRAGVKVYVEPAGLPRDAAIEDMAVVKHQPSREELARQVSAGPDTAARDLRLVLRNAGGVQIRPAGRVEIRRPDNSVAGTITVEEFPVLPGATRTLHLPLPTLAPGKYIAIALVDFGGAEIAGGQVEFERP